MPLKVMRYCNSVLLILLVLISGAFAQDTAPAEAAPAEPVRPADVMQGRIDRAKAFIAVRNYPAAIFELENIRRESSDPSVNSVANVLLMNSLLEQGNYKKSREILTELFTSYKANNAHADTYYPIVAGQIVKGSRSQIERYRLLGLNVSDRNLPLEAVTDIEQMRETLELIITQAKEVAGEEARAPVAIPILEEASAARSSLARDEYDARRWRDETANARQQMADSTSVVFNAIIDPAVQQAVAQEPVPRRAIPEPSSTAERVDPAPAAVPENIVAENSAKTETAASGTPAQRNTSRPVRIVQSAPRNEPPAAEPEEAVDAAPADEAAANGEPIDVGTLLPYVVRQQPPVYPAAARQMRASGVVTVNILIDENGDVVEVRDVSGHRLLQRSASDAIMGWKFRPVIRDGSPVKAIGFVNFNFSL